VKKRYADDFVQRLSMIKQKSQSENNSPVRGKNNELLLPIFRDSPDKII
jgi:hypothetical protein